MASRRLDETIKEKVHGYLGLEAGEKALESFVFKFQQSQHQYQLQSLSPLLSSTACKYLPTPSLFF
jgi:hypothetical protein